jgi:hypothetical protein
MYARVVPEGAEYGGEHTTALTSEDELEGWRALEVPGDCVLHAFAYGYVECFVTDATRLKGGPNSQRAVLC